MEIGKAITVKDGSDATVIFTGTIGYNCKQAVERLEKEGINCRLISMHTVKPIDKEAIIKAAKETGAIVTVEEHNIMGGLGGAVAEVLMDKGVGDVQFKRLALPDVNVSKIGSQEWLRDQYGLGVKDIITELKGLASA